MRRLRSKLILIILLIIIALFVLMNLFIINVGSDKDALPAIAELYSINTHYDNDLELINITTYDFSKVFIYGDDEYCNKYKRNGNGHHIDYKYKYKSAMIGGLYNSGTNALLSLLRENCFGLSPKKVINKKYHNRIYKTLSRKVKYFHRFNFKSLYNITKHEAIPSMQQLIEKNIPYHSDYSTQELYVIIIKDPYTWIKSLCKAAYYVIFGRHQWTKHPLCPLNISAFNGTMSANQWHGHFFENVVQLYNIYYESWLDGNLTVGIGTKSRNAVLAKLGNFSSHSNAAFYAGLQTFVSKLINEQQFSNEIKELKLYQDLQTFYEPVQLPHIVVRFEDILFRPTDVIDKVCECVGGFRTHKTWLLADAAKPHGKSKTRQQALEAYANASYRYVNYGRNDIEFVNNVVNHTIMQMFGYKL